MPEWYETFFTPLAADFWNAAVPQAGTEAEADFLARELPRGRLLDLPCGNGRHALALRRRGFEVRGFDLAPGPGFEKGDMRDAVPGGPYDGAYCFGNSFGYLSDDDTRRFARNVRDAVKPGARWIIDTGVVAEVLGEVPPERTLEAGGVKFFARSHIENGRLVQECVLSRGAEEQRAVITYRIYTLAELLRLIEECGWVSVAVHRTLDGKPAGRPSRRLLLVADRT